MTKCLDMYYWEQVLFLLIGFIAIALFSFSRIIAYFDITGGGKVVTAFYFLIFLGSILRIIFLFSELSSGEDNTAGGFSYIDNSYRSHGNQTQINFGDQNSFHLSEPSWAFRTPRWRYVIVSEVLHSLGTLLIFSVFLLVTCHWLHMLRKIDRDASKNTTVSSTNPSSARYAVKVSRGAPTSSAASRGGPLTPVRVAGNAPGRAITPKRGAAVATPVRRTVVTPMPVRPVVPPVTTHVGPFTTFSVFMLTLLCAAGLNILLFLRGVYSSEGLMLYDNAYLSLTSVALLLALQEFSSRIRAALRTIGVMSERPTETQSRRILYITATAYLFFLTRAALELVSFGWIMHCWLQHLSVNSVAVQPALRLLYAGLFYWPEVIVLVLALVIASADQSPPLGHSGATSSMTPLRNSTNPRYDETACDIPLSEIPVSLSAYTPYRSPVRNDKHVTYSHAKREYKRISTDANSRLSLGFVD